MRHPVGRAVSRLLCLAPWGLVMIGLGLLITKVAEHVWPFTVEDGVDRYFAAHRTSGWSLATHIVSDVAETPSIIAATAIAALIIWLVLRSWREPAFLIAAVAAQALVFLVTTLAIERQRPKVHRLDISPPTSSFPSGHTSAAMALYGGIALIIALHLRRRSSALAWWPALLLLIPVAVATARMYRGMHHPSDVTASLLNGAVCVAVCAWAILAPIEGHRRSTRQRVTAGASR
jgi:PAP2 superfamily